MGVEGFRELLKASRSVRRYNNSVKISREELMELIELSRYCPSANNKQRLRFRAINDEEGCRNVFSNVIFAGSLGKDGTPSPGEEPSAYIVFLNDNSVGPARGEDIGICAEAMLLAANLMGYAGCMLGSIKKDSLMEYLGLSREAYEPVLVLALGKGIEKVEIEDMEKDGDTAYHRDENRVHHVPKRKLCDILI